MRYRVYRFSAVFLALSVSSMAYAERYRTWVDESGKIRHEIVKDLENPLLKQAEAVQEARPEVPHRNSASLPTTPQTNLNQDSLSNEISDSEVKAQSLSAETSEVRKQLQPSDASQKSTAISSPESSSEAPVTVAPLPDAPVTKIQRNNDGTTEAAEDSVVVSGSAPTKDSSSVAVDGDELPTAAPNSQYNTANYVDAVELQENGFVRETEEGRFYTWVDAEGVVHNSEYPPEQSLGSSAALPKSMGDKYSPFLVTESASTANDQSKKADQFAAKLFKLDQPSQRNIDLLERECCDQFSSDDKIDLDESTGALITLNNDSSHRRFATGNSTYEIVTLPKKDKPYKLKVRSFVQNGHLFYPALVFLDEKMKPVRLVKNIVYEYQPENWFNYGYFEGWVPMPAGQRERYALVITLGDDLEKNSVITDEKKAKSIKRIREGLLHFAVLQ